MTQSTSQDSHQPDSQPVSQERTDKIKADLDAMLKRGAAGKQPAGGAPAPQDKQPD